MLSLFIRRVDFLAVLINFGVAALKRAESLHGIPVQQLCMSSYVIEIKYATLSTPVFLRHLEVKRSTLQNLDKYAALPRIYF